MSNNKSNADDSCISSSTDVKKAGKRELGSDCKSPDETPAKKMCMEKIEYVSDHKQSSKNSVEDKASNSGLIVDVDPEAMSAKCLKNVVNQDLLKKLVSSDSAEQDKAARAMAMMLPSAKVETAQENWKSHHLRHAEVTEYCKKLFNFKIINIMRFK